MKKHKLIYHLIFIILASSSLVACKKFLDGKPNINLEIPSTLDDLQALENNTQTGASLDEYASDDIYMPYSRWETVIGLINQLDYYWDLPNTPGDNGDWDYIYGKLLLHNIVLDNISSVAVGTKTENDRNIIKGEALMNRAFDFFELQKVYGQPYKASTSNSDLGISLRLTSSVTAPSTRATVQQTYSQIINDLIASSALLPNNQINNSLPTKQAAFGCLARVYLSMSDYRNALNYANLCLAINNSLIDFNTIETTATYPMPNPAANNEIVFYAASLPSSQLIASRALVDSSLYALYNANDLRKTIFFKYSALGGYTFNGGYTQEQSAYPFSGVATDEIYLIKAECEARISDTKSNYGLDDLNTLVKTRWKNGAFVPYTETSAINALNDILLERRKELIWRGIRWDDLKRLNQDPNYAITIKRNLNGMIYTLPPNDPHYAFLLPPDAINLGGLPQNPR